MARRGPEHGRSAQGQGQGPGVLYGLSVSPLWVRRETGHTVCSCPGWEESTGLPSCPGKATCSLSPRHHTGCTTLEICLDSGGGNRPRLRFGPLQNPGREGDCGGSLLPSPPLIRCYLCPHLPASDPVSPNLQGPWFPMFNGKRGRVFKTWKRRDPVGFALSWCWAGVCGSAGGCRWAPQWARNCGRS